MHTPHIDAAQFSHLVASHPPGALCRALDIHRTTLARWSKIGAPRVAQIAVYWESPIGRHHAAVDSGNVAAWYRLQIDALQKQNDRLRSALQAVGALSGSANDAVLISAVS